MSGCEFTFNAINYVFNHNRRIDISTLLPIKRINKRCKLTSGKKTRKKEREKFNPLTYHDLLDNNEHPASLNSFLYNNKGTFSLAFAS